MVVKWSAWMISCSGYRSAKDVGAQVASVPRLGRRCRRFESCRPDQEFADTSRLARRDGPGPESRRAGQRPEGSIGRREFSVGSSWLCARRGRPAAAGLSLAIATLLKLFPGALAGYFLLRKRWSELWWAAGFFLIGFVVTGISNWLKLPMSRGFTTSEIARWSMNHVALLPSVYAWCASFAKTGEPSWIVVIVGCMILDLGIMAVLFWATSTAANDSISDGLVFALWLNAMVLVLPLSWRSELVLIFPAYLFALTAALRASIDAHAFTRMGFLLGTILIGTCAAIELIKALPDLQPQTLTALLVFIGTTIILRSWNAAQGEKSLSGSLTTGELASREMRRS